MDSDQMMHHDINDSKNELIENVLRAMENLNPEQKRCIDLLYLQQKSYKEVSELTGYDLKKVKSYIQNGKRNLKIMLSKQ
jgi:RNA polymerase sigma-70 factor (ECF subfamily)